MRNHQEFRPDWVSAPGETILDVLDERKLSVTDFARRMGRTRQAISELLEGRATITMSIARRLERVLGGSVEFWMLRDFQYREDVARLHKEDEELVAELPLGDMIKFGWLGPVPHPADELAACLRFFDVPSVQVWRDAYAGVQDIVAFRTSPSFDSSPAAVAAWLRQGEIEAEAIECGPWDSMQFQGSLAGIRSLTRRKDPAKFVPELQQRCAEHGVGVAVVRAPTGCRASGATRFISEQKALLLLSFRYLSDDHFWFTFFHEAGHLVLHGTKRLFLEGTDTPDSAEEQEANDFAARILIPDEFLPALLTLPTDPRRVIRFATRVGVSPGIVVGQLQHHGRIRHNQLNSLKRRYRWSE